jgi:hypothetical protein
VKGICPKGGQRLKAVCPEGDKALRRVLRRTTIRVSAIPTSSGKSCTLGLREFKPRFGRMDWEGWRPGLIVGGELVNLQPNLRLVLRSLEFPGSDDQDEQTKGRGESAGTQRDGQSGGIAQQCLGNAVF